MEGLFHLYSRDVVVLKIGRPLRGQDLSREINGYLAVI